MKKLTVVVPWPEGLHLRRAATLVQLSHRFQSTIWLKCSAGLADARSILSIMMLCAAMGTALDVEVVGEDETEAHKAIKAIFSSEDVSGTASNK